MSLEYLANNNKHKRDSSISFQDKGHIYTIKHSGCLDGDTGFTSVTTFIYFTFKHWKFIFVSEIFPS